MMAFWQRACVLCGLALLLLGSTAQAQTSGDGSIYSRFGLGELRTFTSPQAQAMGGGGFALPSTQYVQYANPASWSDQVLTRIAVGMQYQHLRATDAANDESRLSYGSLNAVQFGFPLVDERLGVGLAFAPYSRVNYRVRAADQTFIDPATNDTVAYRVDYTGSGGLQQVQAGLGWRPLPALSLGARVDWIFGILDNTRSTDFPGGIYVPTDLSESTRLSGVTGTVGARLAFTRLARPDDALALAAAFTLPARLSGERVLALGTDLDRDTLGLATSGGMDLPFRLQSGLSYRVGDRWLATADVLYEPWSRFESDFALPGYVPGQGSQFDDRLRLSAGAEVLPAGSDLLAPYLQRVAYRLGAYYDQAYVTPNLAAGGPAQLRTLALTGGLSLPSLIPGTRIDVNLEVGTRGTTDANLVRDVFYRVSANVNIGERWFRNRKLR